MGWVDAPGDRKIHQAPIPRLGGVAIAVGFVAPLCALAIWDNRLSDMVFADTTLLWGLFGGGVIILTIGIIDDLRGLGSMVKLVAQILAALLVYWIGIRIEALSVPFFSPVMLGLLSLPVTVLWILLVTNAINLIDGMDGLAGGVVVLAGGTLLIMSGIEGNSVAVLLLCCLVGATLGFLVYNIHPASIFMGDTGSLGLGFVLALVSIHSSQKSYALFSIVAAMLVLALPIFDLTLSVVRRWMMGKSIFRADSHHIHHVLLRKGLSQSQSVIVMFGTAVVLEILAFVFIYADDSLSAVAILVLIPLGAVAIRFLGYDVMIRRARRIKMLQTFEETASKRADRVTAFRTLVNGPLRPESLMQALEDLAISLSIDKVELKIGDGSDLTSTAIWTRPTRRDKDVELHVFHHQLTFGELQLGELRLHTVQSSERFFSHDVALFQTIADALVIHLARHRGLVVVSGGGLGEVG